MTTPMSYDQRRRTLPSRAPAGYWLTLGRAAAHVSMSQHISQQRSREAMRQADLARAQAQRDADLARQDRDDAQRDRDTARPLDGYSAMSSTALALGSAATAYYVLEQAQSFTEMDYSPVSAPLPGYDVSPVVEQEQLQETQESTLQPELEAVELGVTTDAGLDL